MRWSSAAPFLSVQNLQVRQNTLLHAARPFLHQIYARLRTSSDSAKLKGLKYFRLTENRKKIS